MCDVDEANRVILDTSRNSLECIAEAARMPISQITADVGTLTKQYTMVKGQVASMEGADLERGDKFVSVMKPFVKSSEIVVSELKDALVNLNKGYEDVLRRFGYNPKVNKASDAFFKMLHEFALKVKKVRSEYDKEQRIHAERDKREEAISRSSRGENRSVHIDRHQHSADGQRQKGMFDAVLAMGQGTQQDIARAAEQRRAEAARTPVAATAISSVWHKRSLLLPASGAAVAPFGPRLRGRDVVAVERRRRHTTFESSKLFSTVHQSNIQNSI